MKSKNSIEVCNVKKKFKVYFDKGKSLKEKVLFQNRNYYEERWVLNGLSFEAKKGEAIGLIGTNGCGKSTTLKLLTKILYPDSGSIEMRGRVSSLIELGAGFHPDLSGRENIYTNASIFGLNKKEIDKRIQKIIDFSELEDFLDNPIRTYSSGMYMRLAFSVAINVNADILLIDEILAVGDINFQSKCFEKLKEIKSKGTTIVIISHSLSQIEQICERTLWLENGVIREEGIPRHVHAHYIKEMETIRLDQIDKQHQRDVKEQNVVEGEKSDDHNSRKLPPFCGKMASRTGNQDVEFQNIQLLNEKNQETFVFSTNKEMKIRLFYKNKYPGIKVAFGIGIFRDNGVNCFGTNTLIESDKWIFLDQSGTLDIRINDNTLLPGKYLLDIAVVSDQWVELDYFHSALEFQVTSDKKDEGITRLNTKWILNGQKICES